MKIFVDFDRVAFDTNRLYELLEEQGIEPGTDASLDYLFPKDGESVEDLIFDDFKIFADQQNVLGNEIIFLSSATGFSANWGMAYHFEKMKRSGIDEFGKLVPVNANKAEAMEEMLEEGEQAMFVDDSVVHLRHARELGLGVVCMHMVRSPEMRTSRGVESVEISLDFPQVTDFHEVTKFMNELSSSSVEDMSNEIQ